MSYGEIVFWAIIAVCAGIAAGVIGPDDKEDKS